MACWSRRWTASRTSRPPARRAASCASTSRSTAAAATTAAALAFASPAWTINLSSVSQQLVTAGSAGLGRVPDRRQGHHRRRAGGAAVMFAGRAIAPLQSVVMLAMRYQGARAAMQRAEPASWRSRSSARPGRAYVSAAGLSAAASGSRGGFAYPATAGRKAPQVLNGVTLRFGAGERVAILGRIGSGKSTILRLMAGLYLPATAMSTPTASTCARSTPPTTVRVWASCRRTRACSPARCATTCCWTAVRPTPSRLAQVATADRAGPAGGRAPAGLGPAGG
jgi:ABC-type glutathione transport system ATPase component